MGDSPLMRALAAASLAVALGCVVPPSTASTRQPGGSRQLPGPKMLGAEAEVARQYACAPPKRPLLVLEQSSLAPTPLRAGQEFGHRIVYALCPARASQGIAGTLRTRIRYGAAVVLDDSADFRAEPGRWAVDTFVTLPPHAKTGAYEIELEFTSAQAPVRFATRMPFSVWVK